MSAADHLNDTDTGLVLAPTMLPYEYVQTALIAIVASIIFFTTIVGNIMVMMVPGIASCFSSFLF